MEAFPFDMYLPSIFECTLESSNSRKVSLMEKPVGNYVGIGNSTREVKPHPLLSSNYLAPYSDYP